MRLAVSLTPCGARLNRVIAKLLPVLAQPARLFLPAGSGCLDEPPEHPTVVRLAQVQQLVHDDVSSTGSGARSSRQENERLRRREQEPQRVFGSRTPSELNSSPSRRLALGHGKQAPARLTVVPAHEDVVLVVGIGRGSRFSGASLTKK